MAGFISSAPIDVQFSCFQFLVMKSEAVSIFIFPSFPLLGCVSKELRNWKGCIFSYTKLTPEFHPGLCLLVLEPTDLHLLQPLPMWDIYMLSAYRYERGSRSVFSAFLWFLIRLSCPQVLLVVGNSCEALLFFWASVFICKIQMLSYFMWTHCAWLMSVLIRTHPPPPRFCSWGVFCFSHLLSSLPLCSSCWLQLLCSQLRFCSLYGPSKEMDSILVTLLVSKRPTWCCLDHFSLLLCFNPCLNTVEWSLLESCSVSFPGDSCVSWISTPPPHYSPPFCSCGGSIFAWSSTSFCWQDAHSWINSSIFFWMPWLLLRSTLLCHGLTFPRNSLSVTPSL